ncbi:MAG: DUF3263 domain-containing protein [Rhodococcus sp. (in: high G+C Gram-positive bacteria)]
MEKTVRELSERERMLAFAVKWMPYGGGPSAEILVDFGIAPRTYFTTLRDLLEDSDSLIELERSRIDSLREVCRRRIWLDE